MREALGVLWPGILRAGTLQRGRSKCGVKGDLSPHPSCDAAEASSTSAAFCWGNAGSYNAIDN
jgi:hypothetical protein